MTRPRKKLVHLAAKVDAEGRVSAACYARPRAINQQRAGWTNRAEAITCLHCRAIAAKKPAP